MCCVVDQRVGLIYCKSGFLHDICIHFINYLDLSGISFARFSLNDFILKKYHNILYINVEYRLTYAVKEDFILMTYSYSLIKSVSEIAIYLLLKNCYLQSNCSVTEEDLYSLTCLI